MIERLASFAVAPGAGEQGWTSVVHVWRFDVGGRRSDDVLHAAAQHDGLLAEGGDGPHEADRSQVRESPGTVHVGRDRLGRPRLLGQPSIQVSFTHAGALGLLALSTGPRVGIDVEPLDSAEHVAAIARSYLPPSEVTAIRRLPASARRAAWVRLWTRIEANGKLAGTGIGNLDRQMAENLLARPASVVSIEVGPGFCAALAVDGQISNSWGPVTSDQVGCTPG